MEDWALIGLLGVLYLHECTAWQSCNECGFFGHPGKCRAQFGPSATFGATGGYSFLQPFPPLNSWFRTQGRSFDLPAAQQRLQQWRAATASLRVVCSLLFLLIFGGIPLLSWANAWSGWWPVILAIGVPLWLAAVAGCVRALCQLYGMPTRRAVWSCAMLLLSPLTAIRSLDRTTVPLLEHYHPVMAAYLLCNTSEFHRVARNFLITAADADGSSHLDKSEVELFLQGIGAKEVVLRPPVREGDAVAFCPRCLTQFRAARAFCSDCDGIGLIGFSSHSRAAFR